MQIDRIGFNIRLDTLCHFGDDLLSQSLDWCNNPVFPFGWYL